MPAYMIIKIHYKCKNGVAEKVSTKSMLQLEKI